MQIVIEISEEIYQQVLSDNFSGNILNFIKAVKNGIPLPKGHGRLIDADVLQAEMEKDVRRAMSFVDLKDFVWLAPTIIEADGGGAE
ncbi:MAG: hypothetical protein J5517_05695 [Eubacterium sp.]|nr:hypothetical protein [Eubacterium sp.]